MNLNNLYSFKFESFGVKVGLYSQQKDYIKTISERLKTALPNNLAVYKRGNVEHKFEIEKLENGETSFNYRGNKSSNISETVLFNYLERKIRITVAGNAASKVFVHAGVVSINHKAIILPATSYGGKTTLVKEFVKKGADYFSDEYAVLDEKGYVHPFPKTLSVRGIIDDDRQVEIPAENYGGKTSTKACRVALILITRFQKNAIWNPTQLSIGETIMDVIPHTLTIRTNTKFTLNVLNKVAANANRIKSFRGEASNIVEKVIELVD